MQDVERVQNASLEAVLGKHGEIAKSHTTGSILSDVRQYD